MSNDKDLNISNYNYPEILGIFNAKRVFTQSVITDIEDKLKLIKQKLTYEYYLFYYKAYRMIYIIHELFKKDVIQDAENINHIEFYVNNIKKIESFENIDIYQLFDLLQINPTKKSSNSDTISNTKLPETKLPETKLPETKLSETIINSFPYPVAPTELNKIKRVTLFKNICLNSCFRANYYTSNPTDYQYVLPCEIKNVVSMRLASIELPNSWYLYNDANKNNTFRIEITEPDKTVTSYDIVIPEGNYDTDTITEYLNNTYFCFSLTSDIFLQQLQYSISEIDLKSNITVLANNQYNLLFSVYFSEDVANNVMDTFGWKVGFRLGAYKNFYTTIVSEGMFDGLGDQYIYVSINDYQYNNISSNIVCFDNSVMEENIIGKIPITNGKMSIIITESNSLVKTRKYNGPVNIRNLHIKILNKFGEIVNLNHMDFSFTLEMEILYENFGFNYTNSVR
jgi:hypothetical protein